MSLPTTRAELITAMDQGLEPRFLFFWGHTPPKGGPELGRWVYSQWYPSPFEVDGDRYPAAEHYMMAEKARLFGDEAIREQILAAATPGEAKKLGRQVRDFDEATWEAHRFEIVIAASMAKYSQNPELLGYLVDSGERVLVEAAPRDRVWGIGLGGQNPAALDPRQWRGENLLGFALMVARERLRG